MLVCVITPGLSSPARSLGAGATATGEYRLIGRCLVCGPFLLSDLGRTRIRPRQEPRTYQSSPESGSPPRGVFSHHQIFGLMLAARCRALPSHMHTIIPLVCGVEPCPPVSFQGRQFAGLGRTRNIALLSTTGPRAGHRYGAALSVR